MGKKGDELRIPLRELEGSAGIGRGPSACPGTFQRLLRAFFHLILQNQQVMYKALSPRGAPAHLCGAIITK